MGGHLCCSSGLYANSLTRSFPPLLRNIIMLSLLCVLLPLHHPPARVNLLACIVRGASDGSYAWLTQFVFSDCANAVNIFLFLLFAFRVDSESLWMR